MMNGSIIAIKKSLEEDKMADGIGIHHVRLVLAIYTSIMVIIFSVGIIGNVLVIYVVGRFSCMQTVTNIHLLSLSIADTLYLSSMPFILYSINFESGFPFKMAALCSVFWFLHTVNWFAGTFSLTAMSADRYLAILHPFKAQNWRNTKNTVTIIIVLWIVAIALMIPTFISPQIMETELADNSTTRSCSQHMTGKNIFTYYSFTFGYLVPSCLITFFYSKVIYRLRTLGPQNKSKDKRESQKKTTRLVLTVVLVYILFWLPYWVFQLHSISSRGLDDFENITETNGTFSMNEGYGNSTSGDMVPLTYDSFYRILINYFCSALGFLNSALNPVLYAFLSPNFRKSFWHLFTCGIQPRPIATNGGQQRGRSTDAAQAPTSRINNQNGNTQCERNDFELTCDVHQVVRESPIMLIETNHQEIHNHSDDAENVVAIKLLLNRSVKEEYEEYSDNASEQLIGVMETDID